MPPCVLENQDLISTLEDTTKQDFLFLVSQLQTISSKFYIVGGTIRDYLLKKDFSKDIDIEVYDVSFDNFSILMSKIGACGVGKSFFVYKWKNFDISLPRIETKISSGYRGFEVEISNDERLASQRRDFTINALMYDINNHKIIDFWGGLQDLQTKTIKAVNNKSFIEDSLRVLRAIRFAAVFGFKIDSKTMQLICEINLDDLNKNRIANELISISNAIYWQRGIYYLAKTSVFTKLFNIKITFANFLKITRMLRNAKKYGSKNLTTYYFFYILKMVLKLENMKIFGLPNVYSNMIDKQPIYDKNIALNELFLIASEMPISIWLGAINENIINISKGYKIYDEKLETDVNIDEIVALGFEGKEIKNEILRRKIKYISDKIKAI